MYILFWEDSLFMSNPTIHEHPCTPLVMVLSCESETVRVSSHEQQAQTKVYRTEGEQHKPKHVILHMCYTCDA